MLPSQVPAEAELRTIGPVPTAVQAGISSRERMADNQVSTLHRLNPELIAFICAITVPAVFATNLERAIHTHLLT